MPAFRGKRATNAKLLESLSIPKWGSLELVQTLIDDRGIEALKDARNLAEVHIASDLITDRSMSVLCALPELGSLLLDPVPLVTDAGIAHVTQASKLCELYLHGTQLTDAGVDSILGLSQIWSLKLTNTRITDAGVMKLAAMPKLRIVHLEGTQVRGPGLTVLPNHERFYLYVDSCPIDDAGLLPFLKTHDRFQVLSLSGTMITDEVLPRIAANSGLGTLRLQKTAVTDAGVECLCGHPTLRTLYLDGTKVSEQMAARLKAEAPHHLSLYR